MKSDKKTKPTKSNKTKNTLRFCVYVEPTTLSDKVKIDFSIETNGDELNMTFDEVLDNATVYVDKKYPQEFFPDLNICSIFIYDKENKDSMYPVVSESDKKTLKKLEKSGGYEKILILPDALYRLTPAALLATELSKYGIIKNIWDADMKIYSKIIQKMEKYFKFHID